MYLISGLYLFVIEIYPKLSFIDVFSVIICSCNAAAAIKGLIDDPGE